MNKNVVIISTGGTIAMKYDPVRGGVFPAVTGAELVEAVPPLQNLDATIKVLEFSNIPSAHITPKIMLELAAKIDEVTSDEDVLGVVITHGTDTIEETAYFLELVLETEKPVCLTAAQRNPSQISPDGPNNMLCAVKTVLEPESVGKGVLVVLNDEIHHAADVTKTHSSNVKTFASPFWGPLGIIDEDRVFYKRASTFKQKIEPGKLIDDVHLLKTAAGMDDYLLQCLIHKKVKGIVIEGLGRGNVPPAIVPGIKLALDNGIPVILASRVFGGRVLDIYAFEGGVKPLKELGVILAGELSGQKARIKLILALSELGEDYSLEKLAKYFEME